MLSTYTGIADRGDINPGLLEANNGLIDNVRMSHGPSTTKTGNHPVLHHIEHWLIGMGMSVLAYLLEKAVLRSVKRGKARL